MAPATSYFAPMRPDEPANAADRGPDGLPLFLRDRRLFLGYLRRHVESDAAAEDLLQYALLKAIRHQAEWAGKENVLAWFYRLLRNILIDHYRARAAERRKQEAFATELAQAEPLPDPMPAGDRESLCACFEGLLPVLNPEYAELIRRVDLGGEEPVQAAARLGITANNLNVRLHRARRALRAGLEKTCGICSEHGCLDCSCRKGHGSPGLVA